MFIIGDTWVKDHNDLLEVQASTKPLIEVLHAIEPDAAQAILFACETRTQGFAFYAHRPLTITRKESDLVGEPTDDQLTHLYSNAAQCARRLTGGKPAHGIVKTARYSQVFDPAQWRELARAGSFSLIANHPAHAE